MLWEGMGFGWAEVAYSGVTYPLIAPALERIPRLGYQRIIVFPYFLFTGVLVKRIYEATDVAAAASSNIEFIKAPYLRDHPLVVDSFMERLGEISTGQNLMNCLTCKYREQKKPRTLLCGAEPIERVQWGRSELAAFRLIHRYQGSRM